MKKKTTVTAGPELCPHCGEDHGAKLQELDTVLNQELSVLLSDRVGGRLNAIAKAAFDRMEEQKDMGQMPDMRGTIEDIKEQCKEQIVDKLKPDELGNALIEALCQLTAKLIGNQIRNKQTQADVGHVLKMVHDAIGEHLHDPAQPKVTDPFPER